MAASFLLWSVSRKMLTRFSIAEVYRTYIRAVKRMDGEGCWKGRNMLSASARKTVLGS
jgi:hypothetical protein